MVETHLTIHLSHYKKILVLLYGNVEDFFSCVSWLQYFLQQLSGLWQLFRSTISFYRRFWYWRILATCIPRFISAQCLLLAGRAGLSYWRIPTRDATCTKSITWFFCATRVYFDITCDLCSSFVEGPGENYKSHKNAGFDSWGILQLEIILSTQ